MKWFSTLKDQQLNSWSEPLVDCHTCQAKAPLVQPAEYQSETKCCRFSPFWGAFAIGAWLEDHDVSQWVEFMGAQKDLIPTVLGIIHSPIHHQQSLLCGHFDQNNARCRIWNQRPSTCFHFYCTSQSSFSDRQKQEWHTLRVEADFLKKWFFTLQPQGYDLWKQWSEFMDDPKNETPKSLCIDHWDQAASIYSRAWHWLRQEQD